MAELQELIENADDAYYATEYDKAIELYKQALDSDPDNKHAQDQIRKAERSRPSTSPNDVPIEAVQLYKRSRSFIAARELNEARKLLRKAIKISSEAGVDFAIAQDLLKNIQNALKAVEFKKKAFEELDTQQWARAVDDLYSAINLDPTDDVIQILLSHLNSLINANNLINSLNAGVRDAKEHSEIIKEIREIINLTNKTTALSKLWQEVVRLFGEYNNRKKQEDSLRRDATWANRVWTLVFFIVVIIAILSARYLQPHRPLVFVCPPKNGLEVTLHYPIHIANGDTEEIKLMINNVSGTKASGTVVVVFKDAEVDLKDSNIIRFDDLIPSEQPTTKEIHFSLNAPYSPFSNEDQIIHFNVSMEVNGAECIYPKDYAILVSPIYGLRLFIGFLLAVIAVTLSGLFKDRIKEGILKLLSFFKVKSG